MHSTNHYEEKLIEGMRNFLAFGESRNCPTYKYVHTEGGA